MNDIVFENVMGVGLRLTAAAGSGANFDVTIANQLDDLNNSTGIGIERVELSAGWLDLKDHLLNNFSGNFQT